ncbi:MAG: tetratricopeptide repeat protein [Geminocystis sp.]|nr:tetratricopeptide repeat protein [Geminocystis sp.]MCS7148806.1 tetratricopeptide repeat protein [Geminocystis sp.]MDW8115356.1 tetratricopeptide repeat protein [Geminocystis sp.]MDW8462898.1 tetratricopeptide repeat protein [Geminocystis sp.]HIK38307.1 tetratricopeptide repeat protein [Geminocystis sp. M7585_C2015_104]
MNCFSLLQQQQQDFCLRLQRGNLLHKDNNFSGVFGEVVTFKSDFIRTAIHDSHLDTAKIVDKFNCHSDYEKVFTVLFYQRLIVAAVLSCFSDLLLPDFRPHSPADFQRVDVLINRFVLKQNHKIRVYVKTFPGYNYNNPLAVYQDESEQNHIFIFCSITKNSSEKPEHCSLTFLGFLPRKILTNRWHFLWRHDKQASQLSLRLEELFYMGGFSYCLSDVVREEKYHLEDLSLFIKRGEYSNAIIMINSLLEGRELDDFFNGKVQGYKFFFFRALCYYKLGNFFLATRDCLRSLDLNPSHHLTYHLLGVIYLQSGKYKDALECFNREIALTGINFFAYFYRGFINAKLNNLNQSLEDYTIAIQIDNSFFQSFYNRAGVYYRLGDKYSAIEDYLNVIKLNPNFCSAYYNLGVIYQKLGQHQKAMEYYKKALDLNPNHIPSHYNLGILQADLGLYKQCLATYETILKINPNFWPAFYNKKYLEFLLSKEGNILETIGPSLDQEGNADTAKLIKIIEGKLGE